MIKYLCIYYTCIFVCRPCVWWSNEILVFNINEMLSWANGLDICCLNTFVNHQTFCTNKILHQWNGWTFIAVYVSRFLCYSDVTFSKYNVVIGRNGCMYDAIINNINENKFAISCIFPTNMGWTWKVFRKNKKMNRFQLLTCASQTSTVLGNPFKDPESIDRKICER